MVEAGLAEDIQCVFDKQGTVVAASFAGMPNEKSWKFFGQYAWPSWISEWHLHLEPLMSLLGKSWVINPWLADYLSWNHSRMRQGETREPNADPRIEEVRLSKRSRRRRNPSKRPPRPRPSRFSQLEIDGPRRR